MRQKWRAERKENRATLSGGPRHFICQTTTWELIVSGFEVQPVLLGGVVTETAG